LTPFEEVKEDEVEQPEFPEVPTPVTVGDAIGAMITTVFITALSGGMLGICWNRIAPTYLYFLPKVCQHMEWIDAMCFIFVFRSVAMGVFLTFRFKDFDK
jgi:hypothetical protein